MPKQALRCKTGIEDKARHGVQELRTLLHPWAIPLLNIHERPVSMLHLHTINVLTARRFGFASLRTGPRPPPHLLLETASFEAALARPLTPAVRAGSMLLLLDCALNLPHVFGFKLARKEDLGDWVVVGLLAVRKENDSEAISAQLMKTNWNLTFLLLLDTSAATP